MTERSERFRQLVGKTEVGLPRFSPEERKTVLQDARSFVIEVRSIAPEAGVSRELFQKWIPRAQDFAQPEKIANNIHAHHNKRHVGAVVGEEMFLLPYVNALYADNLSHRKLLTNAVYAGAAGHDLLRTHDVWGAVPKRLYKVHGEKMAQEVREEKRFPDLSPIERSVAATSIQYHDVDPRKPSARNPEDELLAIVDRGELARLMYGVGIIATSAQKLEPVIGKNLFESQQHYDSYYFPGLAEKIQPLSKAMLILSLEGIKNGLSQTDAVWHAMEELGMTREQPVVLENPAA
ncbi:MAG TPA: hypothetical protein VLB73_03810 [Patescibacteria group bacterium]|nr:hypothetical protein [Patescibacteria group bacterium]